MITRFKKALVLTPHPDDESIGCGGTIAKLVRLGVEVHCVVVSSPAERSVEFKKAASVLGVSNVQMLDFPDTYIDLHRQRVLNEFRRIRQEIKPDIVFAPSENDLHQDHNTVGKEALREFKNTTLLAYDNPWKHFDFKPNIFISLEEVDLKKKLKAIQMYESQRDKPFCKLENVKAWAMFRGNAVGLEFAEAFELKHLVM